jgi:hypothetical protein
MLLANWGQTCNDDRVDFVQGESGFWGGNRESRGLRVMR